MKQLLLLLLLASTLLAQAQISVVNNVQDWGTIAAQETVLKHRFIIKNTGSDTLRISRVKPGCSCTVVDYTAIIAPNESGYVNAGLSIHPTSRKQNKSISVYSNDPGKPSFTLHLKANPLGPINIEKRFKQYYGAIPLSDTLVITSQKSDLSNFYYEQRGITGGAQKPYKETAIKVRKINRSKADGFGYYHYTFVLSFTLNVSARQSGSIYFTTNHKDMKIGQIRCFIDLAESNK